MTVNATGCQGDPLQSVASLKAEAKALWQPSAACVQARSVHTVGMPKGRCPACSGAQKSKDVAKPSGSAPLPGCICLQDPSKQTGMVRIEPQSRLTPAARRPVRAGETSWSPVGMQRRSKTRTVQSLLAVAIMLASLGLQWMELTCTRTGLSTLLGPYDHS